MAQKSVQEIVERADEFYTARQDIENVRASVALLRGNSGPGCCEIVWRLSRALFFLGQEDSVAAPVLHAEGVAAGNLAVRAAPEQVEGHFWYGVNLALLARCQPRINAGLTAIRAKRALESAIKIDSAYHGAGPLRVLARLQQELPRLLGGGSARAQFNYERAIVLAPANTVTRVYLAELLLKLGDVARAREQLEVVRNAAFDPDWAFEIKRDQQIASNKIAEEML